MTADLRTRPELGARSTGLRLGALFGPAVFGVTAAGVALPAVGADLGAAPSATVWVLTVHALALGIGTALFGRLSDTAGARVVLVCGAVLLLAGTVLCLTAPGLGVLVAGRFVLAAGSGAMSAAALGLVGAVRPEHRGTVLAVFGAAMAVCAACATLTAGVLTDLVSWRVTLVLPALSVFVAPLCLRLATRPGSDRPVDLPGAGLLAATSAAVLVLLQSSALGLSGPTVAVVAGLSVLGGAGTVLWVRRVPEGFVPRRLVTDRGFVVAAVAGGGIYAGLFAAMYAVPQVLVVEHGWDVLAVGMWLLPGAVAGAVLSRLAGGLAAGRGGRPLAAGTASAFGVALILAGGATSGPALSVVGASLGFAAFSAVQVVVTGTVSARLAAAERGAGLGLLNLAFFVIGGAGSALVGALAALLGPSVALAVVGVLPLLGGGLALLLPGAPPRDA
ncbi:putative MFS family arabinose efflux permease [Nocardiopsis sp. Huas11]|uniref:MFS transporter n=1 Tax=Nocardiopsis sp. Huas11 TaxID=2183912 RepID=UPI000EB00AF9|nr:MFS transporter [Nocardiopsis sp. Huas11]RKS08019.1 putative MFS family arabinose efflux permease [Nocardiopsis sp. Huas11]